ncbi:NAD(P)/FAD-dependent oxidoreductase [Pedobacter sp. SD-b]|uniref:NAD(P)/FAD-dependent oxidoreductase n=1 Tax=Pedobacter segetis TaxID=2793069 RepID=A0ABS1BJF0_9SPHI|nr:FAD-dependent oxidoreductase [Pedobacter segetis]MBK0382932.1 NAD(P)/FAD-dependent oxidoreductase [Pedobacter segetis]
MKIVIIGNGISGITTARYIRKQSDHEILVISAESDHFFSRTALMYIYMGHMKFEHTKPYEDWFWDKNRIALKNAYIQKIDFDNKKLFSDRGEEISYDKLVLSTGSVNNKFDWPGQDLKGVQGLITKQDVEIMEENTRGVTDAVVVGGGLIGIEMAEMLHSRNIHVNFLVRDDHYWGGVLPKEEAELVGRHIKEHGMNLMLRSELKEIISDDDGKVKAIITKDNKEIKCGFVALTAGVSPNISFLKATKLETDRGILVNEFLETNIKDVYALGDCAQFKNPKENHPPVEQLWYTGKMQGRALANTICGNKTEYERGIWFNSAKFLDIEYQTYGLMLKKPFDDEDTFYWEHKNGKISMRANFAKADGSLRGFNFFGIRFKQTVADDWIRNNQDISKCISNLNKGFFDPEFYKSHHKEIIENFNNAYPKFKANIPKKRFFVF